MNAKNISFIISFLLMSIIGLNLNAQGVKIYKNDGTTITVPYSELDSIVTFEAEGGGTTGGGSGNESIAEAIDLGLPSGTKWASWNVGAFSPEEYGGYYAWGETEEKEDYTQSTYLYYDSIWQEYKNIGENISGTEYDVARQKWGEDWRMPTKAEMEELKSECTWTWIQYNNSVYGYRVVGPNGNKIFLPAAGRRIGAELSFIDLYGYYWNASLGGDFYDNCAWHVFFEKEISGGSNGRNNRANGLSVRPVK